MTQKMTLLTIESLAECWHRFNSRPIGAILRISRTRCGFAIL